MKPEQKMNLIFVILGLVSGMLSFFLADVFLSFAIVLVIYFVSFGIIRKLMKGKKATQIFFDSFISFFLVWLVVWIFLFNL